MKEKILGVEAPSKNCTDNKCPFHGEVNVKNEFFRGKIVKRDLNHSATLELFRQSYVPKYERYETRRSRLRVHNPSCLDAAIGQEVVVARTRPLSKTKNYVIIQVVKKFTVLTNKNDLQKRDVKENEVARL